MEDIYSVLIAVLFIAFSAIGAMNKKKKEQKTASTPYATNDSNPEANLFDGLLDFDDEEESEMMYEHQPIEPVQQTIEPVAFKEEMTHQPIAKEVQPEIKEPEREEKTSRSGILSGETDWQKAVVLAEVLKPKYTEY